MKIGDVIQIKGYFGFLKDPKMIVVDLKDSMVKLKRENDDGKGLLGDDASWYGIDLIEKKLI